MTATVADLVAQLRRVRETLAAAAVTATRAGKDARQAGSHYREAGTGTEHPKLKQAAADVDVAADKAAKVARLLSEAEKHFAAYVARIAPDAANQDVTAAATPTGEDLVSDAQRRARKADRVWRAQVQQMGDTEDSLKKVEDAARATFNYFKRDPDPTGGTSAGTVAPSNEDVPQRPHMDNPVTAAIMASATLAMVARKVWDDKRKRQQRKEQSGG